jgi:hypothetical protein
MTIDREEIKRVLMITSTVLDRWAPIKQVWDIEMVKGTPSDSIKLEGVGWKELVFTLTQLDSEFGKLGAFVPTIQLRETLISRISATIGTAEIRLTVHTKCYNGE